MSHEQISCLDALFLYFMVSQYPLHLNVFQHLKSNIRNSSLQYQGLQIQILQRFECLELTHKIISLIIIIIKIIILIIITIIIKINNKTKMKIDKVKQFLSQEKEYKVKLWIVKGLGRAWIETRQSTVIGEKQLPLLLNWLEHRADNVLWNKVNNKDNNR